VGKLPSGTPIASPPSSACTIGIVVAPPAAGIDDARVEKERVTTVISVGKPVVVAQCSPMACGSTSG
jgi:hypothetical protein